ncbi:glycoside hydrolase family protein [Desulfovibrio sp. UCD-KL4C]|uniref:glycoside hydrolase family protein n=1 Tax=Desulfovibrio sp. UCD-KL4C TaxID=2578120 RepID=UPI0025C61A3A|nr:glycoside hydrolase family protein [Desulfovibrio sp. UCD-KL4C]
MDFAERLQKQLLKHEGLKLKPYRCPAGKLTIGVGRNLEDVGITELEAMTMLSHDVSECSAELSTAMPWTSNLSDPRRAVLINMCFNLGFNGFSKFKKMLAACAGGNYELAASEMLNSDWAGQVESRAEELALQMRTGEWL